MQFGAPNPTHYSWPFLYSISGGKNWSDQIAPHSREIAQPPLDEYCNSLVIALGPQHWRPGSHRPFEVILGAILVQPTSWTNFELALSNLRAARLLSVQGIEEIGLRRLQRFIQPSSNFQKKARKLKASCNFLREEFGGTLRRMFATPTLKLREKLLEVYGIGPETADSILLYVGGHGVFVVDAYTRRLLARHGWIHDRAEYDDVRCHFERQFPGDVKLLNKFHALIVSVGKQWCRSQEPDCENCPLGRYREEGR